MHGVDGQESLLKSKLARRACIAGISLDFFVAVDVLQHQGWIGCKRAENMRGLAVAESVEALTQRLSDRIANVC